MISVFPRSATRTPSLRIVHLILSSHFAGSERYCVDLANRQSYLGHEVHVITRANSPLKARLSPYVQHHAVPSLLRGYFARQMVNRIAPDIAHAHLSSACKALRTASWQGCTVATLHVGYKPHQHATLHGVICVNRAQTSALSGFDGKWRVIGNWLPHAPANDGAARTTIRDRLRLAPETFVVGAVGRLHASKGMDVLVSAFRAAAPADAALVIVGEGPQRDELVRLAEGDARIRFVGFQGDVQPWFNAFDLFVSPSREESFGLAVLEAMAAGVPILATRTDGPGEILAGTQAELVAPGSVVEMTVALQRAAARRRDEKTARIAYDLSAFDPAARVADITAFYRELLGAPAMQKANAATPSLA